MRFEETIYANGKKEILKFVDHYFAMPVTVSDAGVTAVDGKKIVPAGTIIGGGFLASETTPATKTNGVGAEGVLFWDVDVTYGPKSGAAIIHGFIDLDKLPEAPAAEAVTALKQITFVK